VTAAEPTLAELSRQVAELKGWRQLASHLGLAGSHSGCWRAPQVPGCYEDPPDFAAPARLYELEGELQQEHFASLRFHPADEDGPAEWCVGVVGRALHEPATPEGRARLILRATLAAKGEGK
jgi:hypothetical protein